MIIYDPNFDYNFQDQSIPEEEYETPALDTSLGVLIAGFTGRGVHNKIIEHRKRGSLTSQYGDDFANFDKYGQANIHAMRLATSKARVFFCSLIPEDAKVAYSVFGVSLKTNDKIPVYKRTDTVLSADGTTVLNYGKGAFVLDNNGEKQQLTVVVPGQDAVPAQGVEGEEGYVAGHDAIPAGTNPVTVSGVILKTETVTLNNSNWFDADGNPTGYTGETIVLDSGTENERTFYPLFSVYYYSRGKGGNYFAYRLKRQTNRDKKTADGRRYTLYFYELLSTGNYKPMFGGEDFNFSFNKDAVYSTADSTSEYLGNIYTNIDDKAEAKPLQLTVFNDSYEALLDAIIAAGANEESSKYDIDILNCIFKNGNAYNKIVEPVDSIDIENTIITLDHGTDGSIEVGATVKNAEGQDVVVTAESAAAKKTELLVNFFNCDIDDDIFDEKITDIDVVPDENYPEVVKRAIMTNFSEYRHDIHIGIDFGTDVRTPEEAIAKCRELNTAVNSEWSFMSSFYGQAGLLKDKKIDGTPRVVTATYDWCAGLADNFAGNGAFTMRAGATRGKVKYFTPFWVAKKNKKNTIETLEELHINNIQYLNKNKELVYMLEDTQYEVANSKMLSVRNSIVIGRLIKMCAGVTPYYKFDERDIDKTMEACKGDLEKNTKLAKIPANIKVVYNLYQTKEDVKEENAHIGIDVTFPNYAKKFHVEIRAHRPTSAEE